jgi:preprotein translocase subunit SecA
VAAIAVIKILTGISKVVDVVTSSPILAERDAEEWSKFYNMFALTAGHNGDVQAVIGKPKPCYAASVVYGDASTFEGDILRDEFSQMGTRGGRGFDTVVVDEVDSMFIDGSNHSTRLDGFP